MKRFLSLILIISTVTSLLLSFSSCKDNTADNDDDIIAFDIKDYTIIRSDIATNKLIKAIAAIKTRISNSAKIDLTVSDDWYAEGENPNDTAKEILVGNTNRDATEIAKAKLDAKNDKNAFII